MEWTYDDGGREAAGFKGSARDCVTRSIAIATGLPYSEIYNTLNEIGANERTGVRKRGKSSARNGVFKQTYRKYLASLGYNFVPTMAIGSGCTVHLAANELPMGRLIVAVSKHLTAVIDGVIHDTFNPSDRATTIYSPNYTKGELPKGVVWLENGNGWAYSPKRCVYGYWKVEVKS